MARVPQIATIPTVRAGDMPALTGLRFLAAAYVILFHSWPVFLPSHPGPLYWKQFVSLGYVAVSFFFVLSGFILTKVYCNQNRPLEVDRKAFYEARFARIYPMYAISLLVSAPFALANMATHGKWYRTAKTLFLTISNGALLQAWHPLLSGNWNRPTWSVSVEALFYLLFPVAGNWIFRRRKHANRIILLCWMISVASSLLCWSIVRHMPPSLPRLEIFLFNPLLRLPEFLIGICFAALPSPGRAFGWHRLAQFGVITCLVSVPLLVKLPWLLISNGLLAPLFGLVILSVSTSRSLISRMLGGPLLVRLGDASFSMYLLHFPVLFWMSFLGTDGPVHEGFVGLRLGAVDIPGYFALYWSVVIGVSLLGHSFIENPARHALRAWFQRPRSRSRRVLPVESEPVDSYIVVSQ